MQLLASPTRTKPDFCQSTRRQSDYRESIMTAGWWGAGVVYMEEEGTMFLVTVLLPQGFLWQFLKVQVITRLEQVGGKPETLPFQSCCFKQNHPQTRQVHSMSGCNSEPEKFLTPRDFTLREGVRKHNPSQLKPFNVFSRRSSQQTLRESKCMVS